MVKLKIRNFRFLFFVACLKLIGVNGNNNLVDKNGLIRGEGPLSGLCLEVVPRPDTDTKNVKWTAADEKKKRKEAKRLEKEAKKREKQAKKQAEKEAREKKKKEEKEKKAKKKNQNGKKNNKRGKRSSSFLSNSCNDYIFKYTDNCGKSLSSVWYQQPISKKSQLYFKSLSNEDFTVQTMIPDCQGHSLKISLSADHLDDTVKSYRQNFYQLENDARRLIKSAIENIATKQRLNEEGQKLMPVLTLGLVDEKNIQSEFILSYSDKDKLKFKGFDEYYLAVNVTSKELELVVDQDFEVDFDVNSPNVGGNSVETTENNDKNSAQHQKNPIGPIGKPQIINGPCNNPNQALLNGICRDIPKSGLTKCGVVPRHNNRLDLFAMNSRIVGGTKTKIARWPWQITMRDAYNRFQGHICGGSIIHPKFVISAAHCFALMLIGRQTVDDLKIQIVTNIDHMDDAESYRVYNGHINKNEDPSQVKNYIFLSKKITVHPGFNLQKLNNDVALIELEHEIPLSHPAFYNKVVPVCLESEEMMVSQSHNLYGQDYEQGNSFWVTGFGSLKESSLSLSNDLMQVNLPFVKDSYCQNYYKNALNFEITDHMLCAGATEGRDSCQGDSGGPLVRRWHTDQWVLSGVVSFAMGCARRGVPGVYVRVSKLADWVYETSDGQVFSDVRICGNVFLDMDKTSSVWNSELKKWECQF